MSVKSFIPATIAATATAIASSVAAQDVSTFGQGCADVFRVVTTFPDRNCEVSCYDREWLTQAAQNADANGDGQVIATADGVFVTGVGESQRYTEGRVKRLQPVLSKDLSDVGITAAWTKILSEGVTSGTPSVTIHFADNVNLMRRNGNQYKPASGVTVSGFSSGQCLRRQ